ncbi:MAG TPA: hypothetical protein VL173_13955 [Vicinamibacterales bacterium]|nr:hypothetical protein [Vicinamibacterales bacterium]
MDEPLRLVRNVLDKQIYDANDVRLGKVDGVVLLSRQGRPPRVIALVSSMPTAWRRLSPRLGDWIERFQRWLAPDLRVGTRIRFEHVVHTGIDVNVDIDGTKTDAFVWENWIRKTFVEKMPGGTGSGEKGE